MLKIKIFSLILIICTLNIIRGQQQINFPVTIRDLTPEKNPDFEIDNPNQVITGIVDKVLGSDRKPVYCCGDDSFPYNKQYVVHNQSTFYSWFNDVPGVNIPIPFLFTLTNDQKENPNIYKYKNDAFFPIDGMGWEAPGADPTVNKTKYDHNYHFCLELHARFTYLGNETFDFQGDDDVWVFINNQLVVDLGAPHEIKGGQAFRSLNLDTLGLTKTKDYPFDFFYCERHSVESHIEVSTSIQLKCGYFDYCGVCEGDGSSCCHPDTDCNDGDACTIDKCPPPKASINRADIKKHCSHEVKICENNDICSQSVCDPTNGQCKKTPHANCFPIDCKISSCNPGAGCQWIDMVCDANKACQTGKCSNNTCTYTPIPCEDNNACTANTCKPDVGCVFTPIICEDYNSCTLDSCDPKTGCKHENITGCVPCSSTTLCQTVDFCHPQECNSNGTGCVTKELNCDDLNPCTIDSCSNGTCVNEPKCKSDSCRYASCNNATGECSYTDRVCNDGNHCTKDLCNSSLPLNPDGSPPCVFTPDACDDNNACTLDLCNGALPQESACLHTPIICPNRTCMDVECIPSSGCVYTPTKCNSENFCDVATCDIHAGGCITYNRTCDAENRDCQNTTCNREEQKCQSSNYDPLPFKCQSAAVKAGVAVGTAAIAGIVIGAAAAVGLAVFGGKKGYDIWKSNRETKMSVTASNPLYTPSPNHGTNPLYGGGPTST